MDEEYFMYYEDSDFCLKAIEHQSAINHGFSVIGDDCVIRQGVTLGNRYLEKPLDAPKLGNRVNIGAVAKILGNVNIDYDVNIGATAVGIPAKIINDCDVCF